MGVHNLYLLDKDGISLIDVTIGNLKLDPNLASGFFSAITKFIKELLNTDEEVITDMGMLNIRLYFVYNPPLIGVIAVDPEDNKEEVTSTVKFILKEFQNKYNLTNWDHDAYPFKQFSKYMKDMIKKHIDKIKYKIFYKAFKIYNKYEKYGIKDEWDNMIEEFQQELGPRFMIVTNTLFDYMGSKIMGEDVVQKANHELENDLDTKMIVSNTSINIWNKDLCEVLKDSFKYLHKIDTYFNEKYHS
ncbi:MAG: hypothetical protein HWN67_16315 [Candidatus Helarchaeota archaeon]|nr:hypothetical protein [Candidatus Helarchaeota archaeon]